ncbi:hypothetical protein K7432_018458, partial [Basidiobolus ranarum]
ILAGQLYQADEAPRYFRSHMINLSMLLLVSVSALILRLYLVWQNKKLAKTESEAELEEKPDTLKFTFTI